MARPVRTHVFRGKRYNIKYANIPDDPDQEVHGICDSPVEPNKTIKINKNIDNPKKLLETEIHESIHAAFYDLDEAAVDEFAKDLSSFLWRLGYRK
jgi:hypothetical protein